jgi:hypothetical protein
MTENEMKFDDILDQFIEKIEKISIKNALKDKLIINRITGDTIEFITISKVAQLVFSNMENMRYIEEKISEVLERSVVVKIQFENKEEYFTRKLEGL